MKHLGDIKKIDGSKIDPVDVITFGSPCQNLSVAGNRKGLSGDESGLFYEAIRVIKEMRKATNGKYPRYAIWENVKGAFNSNKGADFRAVLENLVDLCEDAVDIPEPPNGRWNYAGLIAGNDWSLAWRLFNSEHWGLAQRRERIALVVDFRGTSAGDVLFEREGGGWNTDARESPEKEIPGGNDGRADESDQPRSEFLVYDARGNGDGKICPTITGDHENRITDYTACVIHKGRIRRLTPLETERLNGFPDDWTNIDCWTDKRGIIHKTKDSSRYRAVGNSISTPPWQWLMEQLRPFLPDSPRLGSLFDGIGGFPLVFERAYDKGTAEWASEIDPFCIAVTKRRLG